MNFNNESNYDLFKTNCKLCNIPKRRQHKSNKPKQRKFQKYLKKKLEKERKKSFKKKYHIQKTANALFHETSYEAFLDDLICDNIIEEIAKKERIDNFFKWKEQSGYTSIFEEEEYWLFYL